MAQSRSVLRDGRLRCAAVGRQRRGHRPAERADAALRAARLPPPGALAPPAAPSARRRTLRAPGPRECNSV
eukprot:5068504-Prymnesium_polylepis.1